MADERPVQHTPKHLEKDADVFDPRHPAASAFAVAQPAAGVVADDVEERGQNLRGGPKASDAESTYADQREVLARQHEESLRRGADVAPMEVDGDEAKPADTKPEPSKTDSAKTATKAADDKSRKA